MRTAQPNANVTTLLDIFLKANPARGKSDDDKQADRGRYKPGDNVLPKLRRRDDRDEADRRMVEETQQLSLRELGLTSGTGGQSSTLELPRDRNRNRDDASRDGSRESRRSRGRQRSRSRNQPGAAPSPSPSRVVEHQASLRSLLSASELDSDDMDEGLVRQVLEELVTEGVDLSQIGLAQEEEITERIAEAVRRRQAERQRERDRERRERRERMARDGLTSPLSSPAPSSSSSLPLPVRSPLRAQPDSGTSTPQHPSGPPLSRPALIDAANRGSRPHHQRSSSQGSSQPAGRAFSSTVSGPDDRDRPPPRRRQSDSHHLPRPALPAPTYTEPRISCRRCNKENIEYELHYNCAQCDDTKYNICLACYRLGKGCKHWFGFGYTAGLLYERKAPPEGYPPNHELPHILVGHRYRRPPQPLDTDNPENRLEAGVFCDVCKAFANACYWKCDYCNGGDWGYCNDCVNQGRHCTHPLLPVAQKASSEPSSSSNGPASGRSTLSPDSGLAPPDHPVASTTPPLTPKSASPIRGPAYVMIANSAFRPLTFTTLCNICRYPIPPSHTRYHCLKCNGGDYDICMSCYHKVNASGRITKEDGSNGWRKCLRGHRMIIIGFEDRADGQRRIVVRDLVGGYALKEEEQSQVGARSTANSSPRGTDVKSRWHDNDSNMHGSRAPSTVTPATPRYPPDGGGGLRLQATWGFWPEEGVSDELVFPRWAEIREAEDINGEWYWGVYCGAKGLFPANHVTTV